MYAELNLEHITVLWVMHFFIIFCRIGTAIMLFPGIGEAYVSSTIRLAVALVVTFIMLPVLAPALPQDLPSGPLALFTLVLAEIVTGLFIGGVVRMMLSLMHVAGMVIAFQSSLASALLFDVNQGSQGSVVGNFMTLLAVTVLFTSNMHHLILEGIAQSYNIFKVGVFSDTSQFADMAARVVSGGFAVGIKIASPVLVVTLLLYLASGVMSRLMPNMQIFFVIIPVQLFVAFWVLMVTISAGMMWYLQYYEQSLGFLDSTR